MSNKITNGTKKRTVQERLRALETVVARLYETQKQILTLLYNADEEE